jgi:ACS family hexuronate transporter-like MFS transporter
MKLIRTRFVCALALSKVFIDPIWYFITFWIARYLVDVYHWSLQKNGWLLILPFIVADLGNVLGGYFTQVVIKMGFPVHRARKIAVSIFGMIMVLSLILGPLVIHSPAMALVILSCAAFGFSAYNSNTMAFPSDVVPPSATASVWGIASVGAGLGGMFFQSASGIAIKNFSAVHGYAAAYNGVFIGYGVLGLIGLVIILFGIGPLVKNNYLYKLAEEEAPGAIIPIENKPQE